ncbi:ATP-dependent sacrificial sulfur transferase LarE [Caproiciproducens sp. NJN-50]|uniref:ATP-dependent sacrificial sulfur transferase LarE n=1 Tax=Caproiciproducens sp. NJN-50 TaxID=2507162 RepID=UPI000FFDF8FF|nr:ATP-dependent sacrificial sulfur transferase LarE [Caproiciproducens sp. NJN-50]QAT48704.1 ATP-dependent sacrificial sulfur transferase LarE [Caproiciproducens sp. NJN-50]
MKLNEFLKQNPRFALAFSGGTDSSYLLYAAKAAGCDVRPYLVKSPFQPQFELDDARRVAEPLGLTLTVVGFDILQDPDVRKNPPDRCYFCKRALFTRLRELSRSDGCELLCDGTNASDDAGDRPGIKALRELGVRSPLRECGLTKPEIRRLSREAGLFTGDKPAYACLATRIPAGTEITAPLLQKIERAEESLFAMGFFDFRVRYFNGAAKLQLPGEQFQIAMERRAEIVSALESNFDAVLLDLSPRKTEDKIWNSSGL